MRSWSVAVAIVLTSAAMGCTRKSEEVAQAPTPAAVPRGGGAPAGPRRPPAPPNWERQDSVRKALMAEVLSTVAGRENEPAGNVFKNVKVSKDMPVKEFLNMMDAQYGRSVSASCTGCHANKNVGGVLKVDYADESPKKKQIARQMAQMTRLDQQGVGEEQRTRPTLRQVDVRHVSSRCRAHARHDGAAQEYGSAATAAEERLIERAITRSDCRSLPSGTSFRPHRRSRASHRSGWRARCAPTHRATASGRPAFARLRCTHP